jgi:hypothetical protein
MMALKTFLRGTAVAERFNAYEKITVIFETSLAHDHLWENRGSKNLESIFL